MTLKATVGIDTSYLGALVMALDDYNKDEERKQYHETLVTNSDHNVTVTIMYSIIVPIQALQQAEKHEYVGSQGIDPNDPDWERKWKEAQGIDQESLDAEWRLNTDDIHNAQEGTQEAPTGTEPTNP